MASLTVTGPVTLCCRPRVPWLLLASVDRTARLLFGQRPSNANAIVVPAGPDLRHVKLERDGFKLHAGLAIEVRRPRKRYKGTKLLRG